MDAVHAAVVGSACAGLKHDAGSGHKVRSFNVCSVDDTRQPRRLMLTMPEK